MANTYIVSGSQFRPYTFDEMIKPYAMYTEAYNQKESQINDMLDSTIAADFNFSVQDSSQKQMYDSFIQKLQQASDNLYNSGLSSQTSKDIVDLKRFYNKEIAPIKSKLNKRAVLAEEQRKLKLANPYIRFDKDYSTANLDEVNDASTYNTIDLSKIQSDVINEMNKFIVSKTPEFKETDVENIGTLLTTKYGWDPISAEKELNNPKSELYKKYKELAAKHYKEGFNKDEIDTFIKSNIISNSGSSSSQFVKGSSSKGGTWEYIGNKAYLMSDSGTVQLEADWDGKEKTNIKKFTSSTSKDDKSPYYDQLKNIGNTLYIMSTLNDSTYGSFDTQDYEELLKFSKEDPSRGKVNLGKVVNNFDNLPIPIQEKIKRDYPYEGYITVYELTNYAPGQNRYRFEYNPSGTGITWTKNNSSNPEEHKEPEVQAQEIKLFWSK